MARRHVGKRDAVDIAEARIDRLFDLAEEEAKRGDMERSAKYISLALRMGERHRVPAKHKRSYCPECLSYFIPPRNVRVRTNRGRMTITCLKCGKVQRYPIERRGG
jgi:ribonuclease P protein subunit RPR2